MTKRHSMKISILKKHIFLPVSIVFLLLCGLLSTSLATAVEKTPATEEKPIADIFEYQLDNRPDPFVPFIKETRAVSSINMDEIIDPEETQLSGMQLFEPDQLKVVGILADKEGKMAMMEDLIGQGYTVRIGTLIGKRGIIQDINSRGVIVAETAITRAGRKKITKIVMALKPKGEE